MVLKYMDMSHGALRKWIWIALTISAVVMFVLQKGKVTFHGEVIVFTGTAPQEHELVGDGSYGSLSDECGYSDWNTATWRRAGTNLNFPAVVDASGMYRYEMPTIIIKNGCQWELELISAKLFHKEEFSLFGDRESALHVEFYLNDSYQRVDKNLVYPVVDGALEVNIFCKDDAGRHGFWHSGTEEETRHLECGTDHRHITDYSGTLKIGAILNGVSADPPPSSVKRYTINYLEKR